MPTAKKWGLVFIICLIALSFILFTPIKYIGYSKDHNIKIEIVQRKETGGIRCKISKVEHKGINIKSIPFKFYFEDDNNYMDFVDIRDKILNEKKPFYCLVETDNKEEVEISFKKKKDFMYFYKLIFPDKEVYT